MTFQQVIRLIESPEFYAAMNIASTYKTFVRLLASNEDVLKLRELAKLPQNASQLVHRMLLISKVTPAEDVEHPADPALAAYLWVLSETYPILGNFAAAIVRRCDKCWWSRQMANLMGSPCTYRSATPAVVQTWFTNDDILAAPLTQDVHMKAGSIMYVPVKFAEDMEVLGPQSRDTRIEEYFRNGNTTNRIREFPEIAK